MNVSFPAPTLSLITQFISPTALIAVGLGLTLIIWIVYTFVATYHWFYYSHEARIALPAVSLHLAVSALIAFYAISGLIFYSP